MRNSWNSAMETRRREALPIHWSAAWSGAVTAAALFSVFTVLWVALAYGGSGSDYFRANLNWYIGGTALVAWYLGGVMAGRIGGVAAMSTATVMWGLTTLGGLIVLVPVLLVYLRPGSGGGSLAGISGYTLWITFGSAIIGLGTAWIGGALAAGGRHVAGRRADRDAPQPADGGGAFPQPPPAQRTAPDHYAGSERRM
jgi:hypothetical protein